MLFKALRSGKFWVIILITNQNLKSFNVRFPLKLMSFFFLQPNPLVTALPHLTMTVFFYPLLIVQLLIDWLFIVLRNLLSYQATHGLLHSSKSLNPLQPQCKEAVILTQEKRIISEVILPVMCFSKSELFHLSVQQRMKNKVEI